MPRACSVCSHPESAAISKTIASGASNRAVADRFGVTMSAVQRHRVNCLRSARKPTTPPKPDAGSRLAEPIRFDSKDPTALVATTARLVDEALELLEHAKRAEDHRTALAALREARDGLQLLMRASGMLAGDNATIVLDQRTQINAMMAKLTEEELRALAHGKPLALPAGEPKGC